MSPPAGSGPTVIDVVLIGSSDKKVLSVVACL